MVASERYAVVSCHVERPLDDGVWRAFSELQAARPSGFRIAALMRPPDQTVGEDRTVWLARAREAAGRGPFGHHTHWGGAAQARPRGGDPAEQVRREGKWLREAGLRATIFCGGGWYFDPAVAAAVAELEYADCTGTAFRPPYLRPGAPRLDAAAPCWLDVGGGTRLLELPTTHSLGLLIRALVRPRGVRRPYLHVYFHDGDLLDRRRAAALRVALAVLARRYLPLDLAGAAAALAGRELPVRKASAR
jgi:hypothetical protein